MGEFITEIDAKNLCLDALYFKKCRLPEEIENIILMYYMQYPRNLMFKTYFDKYATTATPAAPVKTPVKTPEKVEPSPFSPTLPQKLPEPKNG